MKEDLLFLSWMLVDSVEAVDDLKDLKELILESSLKAWLGLRSQSGCGRGDAMVEWVSSWAHWYWTQSNIRSWYGLNVKPQNYK